MVKCYGQGAARTRAGLAFFEDAKRCVQQLPPVLGNGKVKVKTVEKGQQKLEDMMFRKNG